MTARYPLVLNGTTIQELQSTDTLAGQAASGANSDITSLTGLTTALSVPQGGTGATTLTGIIKGNGTGAFTAVTAPTGTIVGTSDTQTLTNKTITAIGSYETKTAMAASAIDLSLGTYFTKTISAATTFTISNTPSASTVGNFVLELTNAGSQTITWWSGLKWTGGTAPTLTASGVDILAFYAHDGGTTWRGLVLSKDSK